MMKSDLAIYLHAAPPVVLIGSSDGHAWVSIEEGGVRLTIHCDGPNEVGSAFDMAESLRQAFAIGAGRKPVARADHYVPTAPAAAITEESL